MCASAKFTHFKLFYLLTPDELQRAGPFWLAEKCTEQNLHFGGLECKYKEPLCMCDCQGGWGVVFERQRKKGNRLGDLRLLAGTPTQL